MHINREKTSINPEIRGVSLDAIARVLAPIAELMIETGLTVQDVARVLKLESTRCAGQKLKRETGRLSFSRLAIVTGLTRSEVAKLTKSLSASVLDAQPAPNSAQKIMIFWHESAKYLDMNGIPLTLPIFGAKRSFESLVKTVSPGIPVRAMLDELSACGAIGILPNQLVQPKNRLPITRGLSSRSIRRFGIQGSEFLSTLVNNLRQSNPFFESTAVVDSIPVQQLPIIRREIASRGATFVLSANRLLRDCSAKSVRTAKSGKPSAQAGVTIHYFERPPIDNGLPYKRRKNLRRMSGSQ